MRLYLLPFLFAASGCAVTVYHPEKTEAEMQVDIKRCTDEANRKHFIDPVAALYEAYDCMEKMGYVREQPDVSKGVEKAMRRDATVQPQQPKPPPAKAQPCRVPCKPKS
jgi:hypothetical protein